MTRAVDLETPAAPDAIYMARGDEVDFFTTRPRFTGDILRSADERLVALVQHPCAMRNGVDLVEKVLVADVCKMGGELPPDWSTGHFKRSFLPDLLGDGEDWAIEFPKIDVWAPQDVNGAQRIAILSLEGVNLLLQRWVFHNTRSAIATGTLDSVTCGPFEEADLIGDACQELVDGGGDRAKGERLLDEWLQEDHVPGLSRRIALEDAQRRSAVRQHARAQTRVWTEDRAAHKTA